MSEGSKSTPGSLGVASDVSGRRVFLSPTVIAALVTAVATIVAAIVGSLLTVQAIKKTALETYELTVSAAKYPFEKLPAEIHQGDEVEIAVLGAHSVVLNCGLGDTTVMGMVNQMYQPGTVLPSSNLCSIIGRIGPEAAPCFPVGAYTKFVASISGPLSIGVNDVVPERCNREDCFLDNTGALFVEVTIRRK
jgi:hypothetical protein